MYFLLYLFQIGVLAFINGGEEGKALYNAFVTGRVCYEVYKRLSVSQADVLRVSFVFYLSNIPLLLWVYWSSKPHRMLGEHKKSL